MGLIECHGTGTALGDPIEVDALKGVLGETLGEKVSAVFFFGDSKLMFLEIFEPQLEGRDVPSISEHPTT